ncbi:uncharacterized protein [Apostichopus japonicus]|uniref:uncharacterized protein isoform X2 n=1 Tax=Stichopus japonicus TaxID=307972 RepID=UPI003AB50A84
MKTFGKLRTAVKLVIYLLRLSKTYIVTENDARMIELFNEIDAAETGEKYKVKGEELFDPVMFRANKQQRVGAVTRKILGKDPAKRTDKEIYHVHVELQQLKSITKYPIEMQRELLRNAWYEDYPSGRIILRYGRRPLAFYIIIGGSAVVLEGEPDKTGRGAAGISKGDVFGDEAITNGGKHNYTVISKDKIQLLCLSKENYIRIFMAGGFSNVKSYENSFIKSISIFKGWPVHLLKDNVTNCKFNYFIGGTVMVEDSQKSKWIFIIKSGSCAVMKTVNVMRSKDEVKRKSLALKVLASKRRKHVTDHEKLISQKLKQLHATSSVESKKRWKSSFFGPGRYIKIPLRNNVFSETSEEDDGEELNVENPDNDPEFPAQEMEVSGDDTAATMNINETAGGTDETEPSLTQFSSLTKGPYMKPRALPEDARKFQNEFLSGRLENSKEGHKSFPITSDANVAIGEDAREDEEETQEEEEEEDEEGEELEDRDDQMETEWKEEEMKDSSLTKKPTHETKLVLIDTIGKGAVFGVLDIAFGPQPSLTLVSNGAECIMISKKLYLKHITEGNIKAINDEMRPYPNDETLQKDLSEKLTWGDHKSSTLSETARRFKKYRTMADDPRLPRASLLPKM